MKQFFPLEEVSMRERVFLLSLSLSYFISIIKLHMNIIYTLYKIKLKRQIFSFLFKACFRHTIEFYISVMYDRKKEQRKKYTVSALFNFFSTFLNITLYQVFMLKRFFFSSNCHILQALLNFMRGLNVI